METKKYLDYNGLSYIISLIKNMFSTKIIQATLTESDWIDNSTYYVQTISIDGITSENNVHIERYIDYSSDESTISTYNDAFNIVASGVAQTIDGGIEFKVFDKPTTAIPITIHYKKV